MRQRNWISLLCLKQILLVVLVLVLILQSSAYDADQTDEFEKLEGQLFKHFKNEKFDEALEIAMELHRLNPKHVNTLYNIAILHSRLGNKNKAYEWFEKAAEAGGLRSFRRSYFEHYIAMLEHKDRDAFQKPDQIMDALAIKSGKEDNCEAVCFACTGDLKFLAQIQPHSKENLATIYLHKQEVEKSWLMSS